MSNYSGKQQTFLEVVNLEPANFSSNVGNNFTLKNKKKTISDKTIIDAYYADYLALLANTSTAAKFKLHIIEQEARDNDFHGNANKTEFM